MVIRESFTMVAKPLLKKEHMKPQDLCYATDSQKQQDGNLSGRLLKNMMV